MFKDFSSHMRVIYRKVKLGYSLVKVMTTDNPQVSVNIPPAVYNQLMAFKATRGYESDSMAVAAVLEEYFGLFQTSVVSVTDNTTPRLEFLEAKVTSLTETVASLTQAFVTLQGSISPPVGESKPITGQPEPLCLLEAQPTAQSASSPTVGQSDAQDSSEPLAQSELPEPSELLNQSDTSPAPTTQDHSNLENRSGELANSEALVQPFSIPMTQASLARRLGVNTSSISRMQSKPNFPEWSQQKDPDGIAWVKSPDTKGFYPQNNK